MSNHFSCNISGRGDFTGTWGLTEPYIAYNNVGVGAYFFFYCAQPNATSASIQNIRTNLREYYVNRLKLDFHGASRINSMLATLFFVLNVPQDYVPSKTGATFNLSELPIHTMPENVLYYDIIKKKSVEGYGNIGSVIDINIDIKKRFKVLPSYKLAFVYYAFGVTGVAFTDSIFEGTVQIDFAVN